MKNSLLLDIFKSTKIDITDTIISPDGGSRMFEYFEISPKDFIRYSKEDIKLGTQRGLVNSLTNVKRAIDCQIDTIFSHFGIDIDKIPKESEDIINFVGTKNTDLPHKLKLIQALKFAPSGLTTKARNLRNKLEHYYKIPLQKEIEESIEIAELFILSCESKTKMVECSFAITSSNFQYKETYSYDFPNMLIDKFENRIEIYFDDNINKIIVTPFIKKNEEKPLILNQQNPEYYFIIRLINLIGDDFDFLDSYKLLLKYINHPIPQEKISITNWHY